MNKHAIAIGPLAAADRKSWEILWQAYLRFYRAKVEADVTETTWRRLLDPKDQPHGLAATHDGEIVGIVHYLYHRTSWAIADNCYLQDLFVDPEARGLGAGRALIQAVYKAADEAGAARVYWNTQEFNAEARALYDTLGRLTSFVQYRR